MALRYSKHSFMALYARFPRRILALALDGLILVGVLLSLVGVASWLPDPVSRAVVLLALLVLLLYDPLLTAFLGGTIGHRALNLRVGDETTGERLPVWRALVRSAAKTLLGVISFASMTFTRRHQAIHDMISHSAVCIRDPARAVPVHFVEERTEESEAASLSASLGRRALAGLGYLVVLYVVASTLLRVLLSASCDLGFGCTGGELAAERLVMTGWTLGSLALVVLAWRGRLPGARSWARPADTDTLPLSFEPDSGAPHGRH